MSDIPFLAAQSALTDAHIRHDPTPESSIAPSTSADSKVVLTPGEFSHDEEELDDDDDDDDVASITSSVLYPSRDANRGLHRPLPPLPDLRFEQSYLAGIKNAAEEGKVACGIWGCLDGGIGTAA
ncbi:hypothetical protein DRE_03023 [Drechslerella stenobrocha 248]|uniref:Uncharacterized protein n=1 Tax=Drechslerella stenobrocha 248 TaxID=1043628 RepID=W7I6I9_9PEZI|nr:hypothetical protein DRE_03023 [Drechslerella stenobrocha 248]